VSESAWWGIGAAQKQQAQTPHEGAGCAYLVAHLVVQRHMVHIPHEQNTARRGQGAGRSVQGAACSVPPWRQHCRVESEDRVTLQSVWSDVDLQPATLCNVIWARLPKVNLDGFDGRNLTKVSGGAARCCEYF